MGTAKKSTWIGGTAFVAVVMMALAWFLLISPVMATADETKAQTKTTTEQNALLQVKVDALKAEFEHIEDYKAELATIATKITPALDLAPYIASVDELAADSEVTVVSLEPQAPYGVTLADGAQGAAASATGEVSTEAPAPAPSPSATPTEAADGEAAAAPAQPATPAAPKGMTAIPVRIITVGTYEGSMEFLDELQHQDRLFLVSMLEGKIQEDSEASAGRPATELGELELTVEGFLYVLPSLAEPAEEDPDKEPAELPHNRSRNPLEPIEGDAIED